MLYDEMAFDGYAFHHIAAYEDYLRLRYIRRRAEKLLARK